VCCGLAGKRAVVVGVFVGLFTYVAVNSLLAPSISKIVEKFDVDFTFAAIILSDFSLGVLFALFWR